MELSPVILAALQRAAREPEGLALVGNRSAAGLFAATAAGKQAAQRSRSDGLFHVVRIEKKGRTTHEICALSERGLQQLLDQGILETLRDWHAGGALGDCPMTELFRRLRESAPGASIGKVHDALRRLHEARLIYLHPWTGPLYEIPEPALALLVGHEVAYYASARTV